MSSTPTIEVERSEVEQLLCRVKTRVDAEDYKTLRAIVDSLIEVTHHLERKGTTIRRLRKLIFGSSSEKLNKLFGGGGTDEHEESREERDGGAGDEESKTSAATEGPAGAAGETKGKEGEKADKGKKRKGHGRNGADAYTGAQKVLVGHEKLKSGDACPCCREGKARTQKEPKRIIRIVGQAPLHATIIEAERLRCDLCGTVFTAKTPEETGSAK